MFFQFCYEKQLINDRTTLNFDHQFDWKRFIKLFQFTIFQSDAESVSIFNYDFKTNIRRSEKKKRIAIVITLRNL